MILDKAAIVEILKGHQVGTSGDYVDTRQLAGVLALVFEEFERRTAPSTLLLKVLRACIGHKVSLHTADGEKVTAKVFAVNDRVVELKRMEASEQHFSNFVSIDSIERIELVLPQ